MRIVADLHVHSKYSRATSPEMDAPGIARWAKTKGIGLVGTGDFTHPQYLSELKRNLRPLGNGLFEFDGVKFILSAEVSNIFQHNGLKKTHHVILAPGFEEVEQLNSVLGGWGNLAADGRPTFGSRSASELVETVMEVSKDFFIIPAHIWTPWFSIFGANSGFDSMKECYGGMEKHIHALETGLSSDPGMNWRLSALDKYSLVSNSDAHSPAKLGREANVFEFEEVSYRELTETLKKKDPKKFLLTYEFYPEEGKYHFDGHRSCSIRLSPEEAKKLKNRCPVCRKELTIGVMHRVDELADRAPGFVPKNSIPFENLVPLSEILSGAIGKGTGTKKVDEEYWKLIKKFGNELAVLHADEKAIEELSGERIARGIVNVRTGKVRVLPGYDGVYGEVDVFGNESKGRGKKEETDAKQSSLGDFG
ncbi:MAG: endonuclease Q family protein [Candidatus Micrarchaeota archaeon]